jgi:hypothetical protein
LEDPYQTPLSQQLWRDPGQREQKQAFVATLAVNSFLAKPAPILGFSWVATGVGEFTPTRGWRRESNWDPTLSGRRLFRKRGEIE